MIEVIVGDCREAMAEMGEGSVDAVVTDPPYELGFMGKAWDKTGVAFDPATWAAVMRVLRPGGYMLAMGGTRTYHRLACAVEDAGFEVRDCLMWLYGTGFPKGKGCLKPAWEPILLARKPGKKVLPLGIDTCRVQLSGGEGRERQGEATQDARYTGQGRTDFAAKPGVRGGNAAGRYPANVLHDGSDEVMEAFAAFGNAPGQQGRARTDGELQDNAVYGKLRHVTNMPNPRGDTGTAARFFYCAKASKSERGDGNTHPTVKPQALMRWLVKLVCPEGGTILDPFSGSGSTGVACVTESRKCVMVEMNPEYADIIRKRVADATGTGLFTNMTESI